MSHSEHTHPNQVYRYSKHFRPYGLVTPKKYHVFFHMSARNVVSLCFNNIFIGPILDYKLKDKILKPERVPTVVTLCVRMSVRLSACLSVNMLLIFGWSDPWDMKKKRMFLFFEIIIFTLFMGIFLFCPYITLVYFFALKLLVKERRIDFNHKIHLLWFKG